MVYGKFLGHFPENDWSVGSGHLPSKIPGLSARLRGPSPPPRKAPTGPRRPPAPTPLLDDRPSRRRDDLPLPHDASRGLESNLSGPGRDLLLVSVPPPSSHASPHPPDSSFADLHLGLSVTVPPPQKVNTSVAPGPLGEGPEEVRTQDALAPRKTRPGKGNVTLVSQGQTSCGRRASRRDTDSSQSWRHSACRAVPNLSGLSGARAHLELTSIPCRSLRKGKDHRQTLHDHTPTTHPRRRARSHQHGETDYQITASERQDENTPRTCPSRF